MRKGQKHNQKTRDKMRLAKLGYIPWNKGLQGYNAGHIVTQETRNKISTKHKGKKLSSEHIKKLVNSHLGQIAWNKGLKGVQSHSKATRLKMSNSKKGEKSYQYIKDRTKIKKQHERNNPNDKQWKYAVYKRDDFKCKMLNEDCNGRLEAHHILPWRDYPELRTEINNGITLCKYHHPRKKEDEARLTPYFKSLLQVENKEAPQVSEAPQLTA